MVGDDDGFSLVEVIIALFLLAVISLAVLPMVVGAVRLSVDNKDLVAATAFGNSQLAVVRDAFPLAPLNPTSCAGLQARATPAHAPLPDAAGTGMRASIAVLDGCPPAANDYPASLQVSVTVRDAQGDLLVTIPTRVRVSAP
ncbi:type II secretion system protein [Microbacterium sp. Sa4CUA7]|uniref:Type II secretion system protein n=1 Tax=Microbacterium pullorum TaxID=2762236 RepID=A0ABR8S3N1_9MICO|nr:type II secretion system protein [Microbacterium pullorum]MBD7958089.1 type II secretion system protein [Microbacterium pullorum]